jgi:hypothetical protein
MGLVKTMLLASSFGAVFDLRRIRRQFLYHRADEQQVETHTFNTSQWLWCGPVRTTNTGRLSGGSTVVPRRMSGKSWLMAVGGIFSSNTGCKVVQQTDQNTFWLLNRATLNTPPPIHRPHAPWLTDWLTQISCRQLVFLCWPWRTSGALHVLVSLFHHFQTTTMCWWFVFEFCFVIKSGFVTWKNPTSHITDASEASLHWGDSVLTWCGGEMETREP